MKNLYVVVYFVLLQNSVFGLDVTSEANSLVVSTPEPSKEAATNEDVNQVNPQIFSMQIEANVTNRFARTLVTSKVRNLNKTAEETTFSVILPENAFISEFEMEIKGKIYKAYVKEKEEAKQIYQKAVSQGQSAAYVELNARDSKTFTVSVNIEPESKTIFRLVYEELLQRQNGQYELVINIHPGQIVDDLLVQVFINESRPLSFVTTPSLRTGNEISKNDPKLKPDSKIEILDNQTAIVKFNPGVKEQKEFGKYLNEKENGLAGQFIVQYDVERDPQGGEVLVRDGYFVHFFAPSELKPLPKHVVFVLDHSGSMGGRKFDQLVEAMQNILSELTPEDVFHIVRFSYIASVWNAERNQFVDVDLKMPFYGKLEPQLREANLPEAFQANEDNVQKAKNIIKDNSRMGMTNIIAGLEVGLFLSKRTQETSGKYQPMVIFLTDGFPNVGMHTGEDITKTVTEINSGENPAPIFSLSFGDGADKKFLRKLSTKNQGISRHIYEAADASLQLQDFYKRISSPLLRNVHFKYVDGVSDITKHHYPIFFNGSELVVAGKTGFIEEVADVRFMFFVGNNSDILLNVNGLCPTGPIHFDTTSVESASSLERLWAYLTVRDLLKNKETAKNATELNKKALLLSLKYSFVTPVTSLVVVKPNVTESVDSTDAAPKAQQGRIFGWPTPRFGGLQHSYMPYMPRFGIGTSSTNYRGMVNSYPPLLRYGSNPGYHPLPSNNMVQRSDGSVYRKVAKSPFQTTQRSTTRSGKPQWLKNLQANNENITTPQGSFLLGKTGSISITPECPKTPLNGTGVCTLIFDCPQVYSHLTDITVYLQYFCPLNEFAGVCCPKKVPVGK